MDVVAHFLWSYAFFHAQTYALLAGLFGVLPDLFAFLPFFVYRMLKGKFRFGKPDVADIPQWVFRLYSYSHSIPVFAVVFAIVWAAFGPQWYLLAWLVHILMDIPTHTKAFFPTPFLYPLSKFTFSGIDWATPWFMLLNYGSIGLVYLMVYFKNV